jgi:acetylornithine deacetylase
MKKRFPYQQLLQEMISIPALSREEHQRADYLENFLQEWGMPVTRIRNNLLVGDAERKGNAARILMNSHLDTVPPGDGWQSDPFIPRVHNGKITGLGSNDAGASVVTMIAAYHDIRSMLEEDINLMLLISAEEEISGANGINAVLQGFGHLDGVIVGEPTGMQPAVAERGLMVIDAEVRGETAHAAGGGGINAIYLAIQDIESIASLDFPEQSEWLPEPGAQVTMISGGNRHNVVPGSCSYVVDVRSNDKYGNEEILAMLRELCKAELIPRSTWLKPSLLPGDHFLMGAITSLGMSPFGSSTLSDMAIIPFPTVKMGPGDSSRSHAAEEYILIRELDEGISHYKQFLQAVARVWRNLDKKALQGNRFEKRK